MHKRTMAHPTAVLAVPVWASSVCADAVCWLASQRAAVKTEPFNRDLVIHCIGLILNTASVAASAWSELHFEGAAILALRREISILQRS